MKRVTNCLCLLGFLLSIPAAAQHAPPDIPTWNDEMAKGYMPYHQLKAEDFPINDTVHKEAGLWIQAFIHYHYHFIWKVAQGGWNYAYVKDWTIFSGFDQNLSSRRSWFREMKTDLPYAQAILNIYEIYARRLAALKPGELPSGSGKTFLAARTQLEERLASFYQARVLEAEMEVDAFSKETKQGQNKKKLQELSVQIDKRLAETPVPVATSAPTASPPSTGSAKPQSSRAASPLPSASP